MSDLNSTDWPTADLTLRRRRDEMDAFKKLHAENAVVGVVAKPARQPTAFPIWGRPAAPAFILSMNWSLCDEPSPRS